MRFVWQFRWEKPLGRGLPADPWEPHGWKMGSCLLSLASCSLFSLLCVFPNIIVFLYFSCPSSSHVLRFQSRKWVGWGWGVGDQFFRIFTLWKINLESPQFVYNLRFPWPTHPALSACLPNPGQSLQGCPISTPLLFIHVPEIH